MKRLLLGVGNRLSGDDGIGPTVASRLTTEPWIAVDCGTAIENASGIVSRERPDLLVVVDAARMGLEPGSIRRLPITSDDRMLASTHGLPLSFVLERLADSVGKVVLIGVEPESLVLGEGLSEAGSKAVDELLAILAEGAIDRLELLA